MFQGFQFRDEDLGFQVSGSGSRNSIQGPMVSMKSIHSQTRQLDFITRNSKESLDDSVGKSILEKPFNQHMVCDKIPSAGCRVSSEFSESPELTESPGVVCRCLRFETSCGVGRSSL